MMKIWFWVFLPSVCFLFYGILGSFLYFEISSSRFIISEHSEDFESLMLMKMTTSLMKMMNRDAIVT